MQVDTHVENQLRIDGHHWSRIGRMGIAAPDCFDTL